MPRRLVPRLKVPFKAKAPPTIALLHTVIARSDPQMPSFSRDPTDRWLAPHGGWRGN